MEIQFLGCNSISDSSQDCLCWLECCSSHTGTGVKTFLFAVPAFFTPYRKMLPYKPLLQLKICQAHPWFIFYPLLLKCINSGFLLECPSVCWREGGGHRGTETALLTEPWGYVCSASSGQIWACFNQKLRTQGLPWFLSCLPPAMWLHLKSIRLELRAWTLDQPKIWHLQQINLLLVVQLCKETSSLTLYEWAEIVRRNLGLIFST